MSFLKNNHLSPFYVRNSIAHVTVSINTIFLTDAAGSAVSAFFPGFFKLDILSTLNFSVVISFRRTLPLLLSFILLATQIVRQSVTRLLWTATMICTVPRIKR